MAADFDCVSLTLIGTCIPSLFPRLGREAALEDLWAQLPTCLARAQAHIPFMQVGSPPWQ